MRHYFTPIHFYLSSIKTLLRLVGEEIVDHEADCDVIWVPFLIGYSNRPENVPGRVVVYVWHGGGSWQLSLESLKRGEYPYELESLNIVMKYPRDLTLHQAVFSEPNALLLLGRYQDESDSFNRIFERRAATSAFGNEFAILDSGFMASEWSREKLAEISEPLKSAVMIYGRNSPSGWVDDLQTFKNTKFSLFLKAGGYICNFVSRSLLCGVPVIMLRDRYLAEYVDIFPPDLFVLCDSFEEGMLKARAWSDEEYRDISQHIFTYCKENFTNYTSAERFRMRRFLDRLQLSLAAGPLRPKDDSVQGKESATEKELPRSPEKREPEGLPLAFDTVTQPLAHILNTLLAITVKGIDPIHVSARERSTSYLEALFFASVDLLRPALFIEVGAHEAGASRRIGAKEYVRKAFAFEANPYTHELFLAQEPSLRGGKICYQNLAFTNYEGEATLFIPCNSGKTPGISSLLTRNSDVKYEELSVPCTTLDQYFKHIGSESDTIAMWVDVEGLAYEVLSAGPSLLSRTSILYVEVEEHRHWRDQKLSYHVIDLMLKNGFLPFARDRGCYQYNLIFVRFGLEETLKDLLIDYLQRSMTLSEDPEFSLRTRSPTGTT